MVKETLKKAQKIRTLATIRRDTFILSLLFLILALFAFFYLNINIMAAVFLALSLMFLLLYVLFGQRVSRILPEEPVLCKITSGNAPTLFQTTPVGGHSHVSFLRYKGQTIRLLIMERDEYDPARIKKECKRVDQVIMEKWNVRTELPARALFGGARIDMLLMPRDTGGTESYAAVDDDGNITKKNLTFRTVLNREEGTLLLPQPAGTMRLRKIRQYIAIVEMLMDTLGEKSNEVH